MEIRHLRCFLAVAEELHFARAAEKLHIEQSPLSRAIKELEEELGVVLFNRTTRSTRLTRAGKLFLVHVRRVFAVLQQARDSVKAAANGFHGQLRVALSDGITPSRLPTLLALCRQEEPEVEIRFSEVPLTQQMPVFHHMPAPTSAQLQLLVQQIAERIGQLLERRGLVERDMEHAWLTADGAGGPLDDLIGHSITYRIAVGPRAGQKLFTLQTLTAGAMPQAEQQGDHRGAAQAGGFSLHAGIDIEPGQRKKLERLCRYVSRPAVAVDRMALTSSGQVRYTLKTPYRDGTTHIVLEPLDLMARLAALVPPPRMHLTRYHGVFAPHSKLRAAVTPAGRGKGSKPQVEEAAEKPPTPRHVAMSWAQRLKRVFGVDIEACARCGGKLKVIASIDEPQVIAKILAHLERTAPDHCQPKLPLGARAPPAQSLLV